MRIVLRLGVLLALLCPLPEARPEGAPNFVLVFVDDQGYRDLGCYGHPELETPHIDRLAREGTRFTDFYSLAPICSASRAALLTGRYPVRTGITGVLFPRHDIGLNPEETTIAEVLRNRGYATTCIGKWHLGHLPPFLPTRQGFDSYYGLPYSNDMDPVKGMDRNRDRLWIDHSEYPWNVPLMRDAVIVERPAIQATLTRRYTREAVRFIRENRQGPFFLYLPHTMPHIPLYVSEDFRDPDPRNAYLATIREIDWSVGEILRALDECGIAGDTLVAYTSDNGPWLGMKHHGGSALPLRNGKFSTFEGGMRVPCLMRWPGRIPAGRTSSEVAATFDFLPTFAALAGARPPADLDGKDISAVIRGEGESPHEHFAYYRGNNLQAIRRGPWKLHLERGSGEKKVPPALYHLGRDIGESTDLSAGHPDLVRSLAEAARTLDRNLKARAGQPGKAAREDPEQSS